MRIFKIFYGNVTTYKTIHYAHASSSAECKICECCYKNVFYIISMYVIYLKIASLATVTILTQKTETYLT